MAAYIKGKSAIHQTRSYGVYKKTLLVLAKASGRARVLRLDRMAIRSSDPEAVLQDQEHEDKRLDQISLRR